MSRAPVLARLLACGASLAAGCDASRAAPLLPSKPPVVSETVEVEVGGRQERVRCALSCEPARAELRRLHTGCIGHPLSTPQQVATSAALLALGCCTEAEASYARACGVEGLEACVSRWSAECAARRTAAP